MAKNILAFFHEALYPPQSGNHQVCLEMLLALAKMDYEVTLLSSTITSGIEWKESNIEALKSQGIKDVKLHRITPWDYKLRKLAMYFAPPFSAAMIPSKARLSTPPSLRRLFLKTAEKINPEIILMNYTYFDHLIDHQKFAVARRIIHSHDLVTLNQRCQRELSKYLPVLPIRSDIVGDNLLKENFFEDPQFCAHPEEFRIYDQYDYTLAISQKEAEIIRSNTRKTKVVFFPVTLTPRNIPNRYTGPAIFPAGSNLFNVQGYLYFVRKVLPQIRKKIPDFSLQMTGRCTQLVFPEPGVFFSGVVPDLTPLYEKACFLISPLLGGTGQQVKIVEAMANGVPAVVLKTAREALPVRHGINGLIATNAAEFAEYAMELWNNRNLCAQLGQAARKTIADDFSKERMKENLALITTKKSAT